MQISIPQNTIRQGYDGSSCCARKTQASHFGTKTQLAGRTLTPMPPAGGEFMVKPAQVRKLTSAQPFVPRSGARCAAVCGFAGRPRIRAGLCCTNAASALRAAQKNVGWLKPALALQIERGR